MSGIFSIDVLHLIDLPKKYYLANELYVDASLLLDTDTKQIILAQNNAQGYVEILRIGGGQLQYKQSCNLLSDVNIPLSGNPIIDGFVAADGYRILLINQTNGIQNGIWEILTGGIWVRPADFDNGSVASNAYVFIQNGVNYTETSWVCSNEPQTSIVGIDPLTWVQFGLGCCGYDVITVTNNYVSSQVVGEQVILCDTSGGTFNVTLPTISKAKITIKKINGTPNLVVNTLGGQTIDGGATATLIVKDASITCVTNGSDWFIV